MGLFEGWTNPQTGVKAPRLGLEDAWTPPKLVPGPVESEPESESADITAAISRQLFHAQSSARQLHEDNEHLRAALANLRATVRKALEDVGMPYRVDERDWAVLRLQALYRAVTDGRTK